MTAISSLHYTNKMWRCPIDKQLVTEANVRGMSHKNASAETKNESSGVWTEGFSTE